MDLSYAKQASNYAGNYAVQAAAEGGPPEATTFITPLVFASGNLRQLVERLRKVSDRLCGATPPVTMGGDANKPDGVFDEVRVRAEAINQMVSEAEEMLSRIERALP